LKRYLLIRPPTFIEGQGSGTGLKINEVERKFPFLHFLFQFFFMDERLRVGILYFFYLYPLALAGRDFSGFIFYAQIPLGEVFQKIFFLLKPFWTFHIM